MWSPLITHSSVHDCDAFFVTLKVHSDQLVTILYILARVTERAWTQGRQTNIYGKSLKPYKTLSIGRQYTSYGLQWEQIHSMCPMTNGPLFVSINCQSSSNFSSPFLSLQGYARALVGVPFGCHVSWPPRSSMTALRGGVSEH